MAESKFTIGSLFATLIATIVVIGVLGPISIGMGVFNPTMNATTPAGQYITSVFGANGIQQYQNTTVNTYFLPWASQSSQTSLNLVSNLAQSSGWAFVFGGIGEFYNSLTNFPKFLYVILIESFSYGPVMKFLPFDIAGLLSIALISYISIILVMKLISLISKPSASVENI